MQIDNILVVSPPNYQHSMTFFDVAMSFKKSLPNDPVLTTDPNVCLEGKTLIFGAHLVPKFQGAIEFEDVVIYQSEQLGAADSIFATEEYIDILSRYPVWDYSGLNIEFLYEQGIEAKHVPIGYNRCMSNIRIGRSVSLVGGGGKPQSIELAEWSGTYPPVDITGKFVQAIDVCFYGSVNERRAKIIEELKSRTVTENGVKRPLVVASFMGYGGFRDKLIARSKIVLNLHYYDSAIFEIFRCSHLFANKKALISETGKDLSLESPYTNSGGFVSYDDIVDRCMDLLHDDTDRHTVAEFTYNIFKSKSQSDILKEVL